MLYYLKRIKQLGPTQALSRINNKIHKNIYKLRLKQKAIQGGANYKFKQIKKQNRFEAFFRQLQEKSFLENIFNCQEFQSHIPSRKIIIERANLATKNCFDLLGCEQKCFLNIPWQQDFKISEKTKFEQLAFYQDIKIETPRNAMLNEYFYDIKVPWELSRFQQTFHLGYAYLQTKESTYAKVFCSQVNDWIDKNPALLGINWVCPMDVAIRAINLSWGIYFFKDSQDISLSFWEKLICSLYDHAKYLENNWETSDKPNNHYLSDLLGYFYLCFIFDDLKKDNCYSQILKQFAHQVLHDGTCYEGSTSYHKLVTEIFWHFSLLCKYNNISLPDSFTTKLSKMFDFLNYTQGIQIGDNDSGKILLGLTTKTAFNLINHYPNFGLTIINNRNIHLTFRHPTYNPKQPTGHFHQDNLAITLSINGVPILVDPGTYLYTANAAWRNKFRSVENHNTFYIQKDNLQKLDLFQLPKKKQSDTTQILKSDEKVIIENYHDQDGVRLQRSVTVCSGSVEIRDVIPEGKSLNIHWNWIFHPEIEIEKTKQNTWLIKHKDKVIASFESSINLERKEGFYSSEYGKIEKCTKLVATKLKIQFKYDTVIHIM